MDSHGGIIIASGLICDFVPELDLLCLSLLISGNSEKKFSIC